MECFRVLEAGEGIEAAILRGLSARGGLQGRCSNGDHPALLVVSPRAAAEGAPLPSRCRTVLLPGDSNGLVYHNEAAVYTPTILGAYDLIEMGDSKFVFVPFCGDNFMWEDKNGEFR